MSLALQIAKRYLLAKKSHHAINIISWISVCGISVATMAMVCTLSVFNGFQELFSSLFCAFDAQIKVSPIEGKTFIPSASFETLQKLPEVEVYTEVLEDNVLLRYGDRQVPATLKGVSDNYRQLAAIDSVIVQGTFLLKDEIADYGVIGIGLAGILDTGGAPVDPIEVCAPRRNVPINMANPAASLQSKYIYLSAIFSIEQPEYDEKYLLVPIDFARSLLDYKKNVTAIELKLRDRVDVGNFKRELKKLLGADFKVEDRYEQQADFFKMMNVEKWIAFLILCFIMLIATFNIIASLSMLVFDKRDDILILRNLGADESFIVRVFLLEGRIITVIGVFSGIVLGIFLCLIQQQFGLLRLGGGDLFIVDAYPVKLRLSDIVCVFLTVTTIGFMAVWYPVKYLGGKWIKHLEV